MNRVTQLPKLPDRPEEGHKGLFGRVLVVGGSDFMIGAPILAGTAALRMGAGLVQVAMPANVLATGLAITPELIGLPLDGKSDRLLAKAAESADAVVVGPGMGTSLVAKKRLMQLIRLPASMVLDADALNLLAAEKAWPKSMKAAAVLTPHPGEMVRLAKFFKRNEIPPGDRARIEIAELAAKAFKQVIVLKGARTVVTDGKRLYINRTGDSSLSKAGSGDILSGMIGTLLAQKMDRFDAACVAVWIHGKAGELAGKKLGKRSVLARDVIDALPEAIQYFEVQT